jgi:signal transduction histidine kinase
MAMNPLIMTGFIAAVAIILSSITYQFFDTATGKIMELSVQQAESKARIKTHDLSNLLENKLEIVTNTLEVIGQAPVVQNKDIDRAKLLFDELQRSTQDLSEFYGWADNSGQIILTSSSENEENSKVSQYLSGDRSNEQWFLQTREDRTGYAMSLRDSFDNLSRVWISQPVIDSLNGQFDGVVYSVIPSQQISTYLTNNLYPEIETTITLMDTSGTILYSPWPEIIGLNYSSAQYQSTINSLPIRVDDREAFNNFIQQSIQESSAGSSHFSYAGQMATTAYSPITVNGEHLMTLYTTVPHEIASDVAALVSEQRIASWILIAVIGASAVLVGFFLLLGNRKLEAMVSERTEALNAKTEELIKSNIELTSSSEKLRSTLKELADSNSKLVEANEQLQLHDKAQREFINIAAHELRTPLQPLLGMVEILESEHIFKGKEKSNKKIEISEAEIDIIARNARRLERLSSDLLEVSRIESQSLKLNKEEFDLELKISNVVRDFQYTIPQHKNVKLVFKSNKHERKPIRVKADKARIFQVLSNLITNAIKFTSNGTIAITVEKKISDGNNDVYALINVRDTGEGIDPDIMPRLFTKFASRSGSSGTGLGLFISKNIIEAHGGRIWAENNGGEKGATFSFTLPLLERTSSASTSESLRVS